MDIDTYLDTAFLLPAQLHFTKLALADCVAKHVLAKLNLLLTSGVVMATPATAATLFYLLFGSRGMDTSNRRRGSVIGVFVGVMAFLGHRQSHTFALNVDFVTRHEGRVEDFTGLARSSMRRVV